MKRLHPDIPLEDEGTVSSKHSITGEVSTSSKTTVGVKAEPIDLVEDGPLDRFANKDPTTKAGARKAVQRAIYECINDLGFPSSTVEKPVFRALLETVRRNAKLISNKDFEISNKLLSSIRLQSYNEFVQLISTLISSVRMRYEELCGKMTPFATLCHDVWNGVNKDVLGLSLMFADPQNGNVYRIPLGLITSQGHTARQVCDLSVALLSCFGVKPDTDLFGTVNDNTNSAVLAGKYILNHRGEGKCDMHITDLILKHATGLVIRTKKKITVDSNPSFIAIYNKFREFSNWLMNKVAKGRYNDFKTKSKENGRDVREIPLPNKTRVAGAQLMFQGLLRNKWAMDVYKNLPGVDDTFTKKYPSQAEWQQLAEYEAVISPIQKCAISIQTDDPATNSWTLLEIYLARREIERMRSSHAAVLSMDSTDYENNERWDASVPLRKLEKLRINKKFEDLMEPTQVLIHRILKEFHSYVSRDRNTHSEHSLCANPFLASHAVKILVFTKYYSQTDIDSMRHNFVSNMVEKFSGTISSIAVGIQKQVELSGQQKQTDDSLPGALLDADDDDEDVDELDIFSLIHQKEQAEKEQLAKATHQDEDQARLTQLRMNLRLECKKQFERYIGFCESKIDGNWAAIIGKFPSKTYLSERDKWDNDTISKFEKDCAKGNYRAVGKYFDVLGWWHHHRNDYPHMYPSALLWLSKPTTNAFQERVFSLGSWFDSNRLMRRQTAHTFQVRTLECITRELRRDITEAETMISIAAQRQQGKTKKMPDPRPRIDINHEQVQRRTTKAIDQCQSLIQVQELYKKNCGRKKSLTVQEESELSFQFVKDGKDTGELLAAVPDMVDDNLDTADDVVLDPHVLATTDSEDVSTDVALDITEEELLENDYELLRSLQDDILTLKVEATQEGE